MCSNKRNIAWVLDFAIITICIDRSVPIPPVFSGCSFRRGQCGLRPFWLRQSSEDIHVVSRVSVNGRPWLVPVGYPFVVEIPQPLPHRRHGGHRSAVVGARARPVPREEGLVEARCSSKSSSNSGDTFFPSAIDAELPPTTLNRMNVMMMTPATVGTR